MNSFHSHNHSHCHSTSFSKNSQLLGFAVFINILLTLAQLFAGYIAGSLSLVADALHNFGDAGALVIALVAHKVAKWPANNKMTFGYQRSEILGALINSVVLIIVALYLLYSGVSKWLQPSADINAQVVIWVSLVALVIDAITAALMFRGAKESINMKAAYMHNLMDALTSFVVMISGIAILYFEIYKIDAIATILISIYIVWHTYPMLRKSVLILMQASPDEINMEQLKKYLLSHSEVQTIDQIHVWQLDDNNFCFSGKLTLMALSPEAKEGLRQEIKTALEHDFSLNHSTLELDSSI